MMVPPCSYTVVACLKAPGVTLDVGVVSWLFCMLDKALHVPPRDEGPAVVATKVLACMGVLCPLGGVNDLTCRACMYTRTSL